MTIRQLIASSALAAALAVPACDVRVNEKGLSLDINEGGRAADEWVRTYEIAEGGRFELRVANGNIDVTRADGAAVEVRASREVRARNDEAARELLGQLQVEEEVRPDFVRIEPRQTDGRGFGSNARVNYQVVVRVPAGLTLSFRADNARVRIEGVQGTLTAGTTNGQIEARGISGGVDLNTVNGAVRLEMATLADDVRITTVNGPVFLGLPGDANAAIEARTVNGGVVVNDNLPVEVLVRERQRFSGRLGAGTGARIELNTTNGRVILGAGEAPK